MADGIRCIRLWTGEVLPLGPDPTRDVFIAINAPEALTRLLRRPSRRSSGIIMSAGMVRGTQIAPQVTRSRSSPESSASPMPITQ